MATDPLYQPITADEFLRMDFGTDRKFELANGVIRMMTGGTDRHAHVAGNLYVALRAGLRGTGCRPFNSDMGVRTGDHTVRYPDIAVICRPDWRTEPVTKAFDDPVAVIEVLSPSTTTFDQGSKLEEYRALSSVETIVFVDPINRLARTVQRQGPVAWFDSGFAQPHDIRLPALNVTLSEKEIFADD